MKEKWKRAVPNSITLIRIILTFIFIFLINRELTLNIREQNISAAAILFIVICFSDFIDGKIARHLDAASTLGGYLDVASDFLYILSSTVIVVKFNIVPIWFLMIIILNFMQFIVTSKIIKCYRMEKTKTLVFDYLGRITAVLLYIFPFTVIIINKYLDITGHNVIQTLVYVITLMTAISFIQRVMICFYDIKPLHMTQYQK